MFLLVKDIVGLLSDILAVLSIVYGIYRKIKKNDR